MAALVGFVECDGFPRIFSFGTEWELTLLLTSMTLGQAHAMTN